MTWLIAALGSSFMFAVVSILDKRLLERLFPSFVSFNVVFGLLQFPVAAGFLLVVIPTVGFDGGSGIPWALASGLLWAVGLSLFFYVVRFEEVSRAAPTQSLSPVFAAIIAVGFLNEELNAAQWLAIIVVVIGAGMISLRPEGGRVRIANRGALAILVFSSFLVGLAFVVSKEATDRMNVWAIQGFRALAMGIGVMALSWRPAVNRELGLVFRRARTMWRTLGIGIVRPMGDMSGSHVTPVDHIYILNNAPWQDPNPFTVRAPAAGTIISIERFPNDQTSPDGSVSREDNRVVIAHTCTLFSIFIHLAELAPEVKAVAGEIANGGRWSAAGGGGIPIEAGQVIAGFQGSSIDYTLVDTQVTLPGFIVPEHYDGESWKVHTVDPYDYFVEPARSGLLSKSPRTAAPLGGKIDYDIAGRAVGNWFLDGTVDYRGNVPVGTNVYWSGHLAIAYDYIDPAELRINIGAATGISEEACRACQGTFGLKTGSRDPASVSVEDGMVKYELVELWHAPTFNAAGERLAYDIALKNVDANVLGVVLVQMLDDVTLLFELFPGVTGDKVYDFTGNAAIYRR